MKTPSLKPRLSSRVRTTPGFRSFTRPTRLIVASIICVLIAVAFYTTSSAAASSSLGRLLRDAASENPAGAHSDGDIFPRALDTINAFAYRIAGGNSNAAGSLLVETNAAELSESRHGHTATRLANGKVLIVGGKNASGHTNRAEIFDADTKSFTAAAGLSTNRTNHTATLLADGRVLIAGGSHDGMPLDSTEIYDAATDSFSSGAMLNRARARHTATRLADGRVLLAGGDAGGTIEIYDPASNSFDLIGATMNAARFDHSAALMNDNRILIVGGSDANNPELHSAEVFDFVIGGFFFTGNEMAHHRTRPLLRVLPDGKVQIIGGNEDMSMEVYDPNIDTIGAHAHLIPVADEHAALMQNDLLSSPSRAALFHHGQADALLDREHHTVTELTTQALIAGGTDGDGNALSSASLVSSSDATVTTDKLDYSPGETAVITGTGWQAGEIVSIILHEDPHTTTERRLTAQADANGNFRAAYLVEAHDIFVTFIVGAKGQISTRTAQTTFTDAATITAKSGQSGINFTLIKTIYNSTNCSGAGTPITVDNVNSTVGDDTTGISSSKSVKLETAATSIQGTAFTGWSSTSTFTQINARTICTVGFNPNGSKVFTANYQVGNATSVSAVSGSGTYGGAATLTATLNQTSSGAGVSGKPISFTLSGVNVGTATTNSSGQATLSNVSLAGIAAGTQSTAVAASFAGDASYTASNGNGSLTVNQKSLTPNITAADKTYDGSTAAAISTRTLTGVVNSDNVTLTGGAATFDSKNVGTGKTVTATGLSLSGTSAGNYVLSSTTASATANITARGLNVTATGVNKIYDGTTAASVTLSDDRSANDVFTTNYSAAKFDNKNVGSGKQVSVSGISISGADAANYTANATTTTSANITTRTLNVTASGVNKVYDGTTTATVILNSDSVAGDNVALNYSAGFADKNVGAAKTVGVSSIAIAGGADAGNYTLGNTTTTTAADITARPVTITADAQHRTYGDADPALTYRVTSGSLAASDVFSGNLIRAAGEAVGTYAIIQGTLTAGTNYSLTFIGANLTISQRAVTVTAAAQSRIYGEADPALTYQITSGSLVSGDGFTGNLTRAAGESVNTYLIAQGTLALSSNYALTFVAANFVITPRAITIAADAKSKTYGDATPGLTFQIMNGLLAFNDAFTGALSRITGESVGTYSIEQGTLALNGNYALTFVPASLTIIQRTIAVTADAQTKTYGDADPTLTHRVTAGSLVAGDSLSGNLNRAAGEAIGTYAIGQGTLTAGGNYNLSFVGAALTISPRHVTVKADAKSKIYGSPDPALTYQITTGNLVGTDDFTGSLSRVVGEGVGNSPYSIERGTLALSGNYVLDFIGANLIVTPKSLTVAAAGIDKVYNGDASAVATLSIPGGIVSGDVVSAAYTGASFDNRNAGTGKTVTVNGISLTGTNAGNYTANAAATTTANITPRTLIVSATASSKVYDGNANAAVMLSDNRVPNDVLSVGLTSATFADAGIGTNKIVTVSGISISGTDAGNYVLPSNPYSVTTTASITAAGTVTSVTINPASVQYSDTVTFSANIAANNSSLNNQLSGSVQFYINGAAFGSPIAATVSAAGAAASLTFNNQLAPNTYNVSAGFVSANANFNPSASGNTPLAVTKEDARVYYTGMTFVNTASATSSTATTTLSATIRDITAEAADGAAYDPNAGNIGNATVTFVDRDNGNAAIAGCSNLPVQPISGDTKTGTITCSWSANIGSADSDSFRIGIVVNNYYTRNAGTDDAVVTVSKLIGTNFITGGGFLITQSSAGQYAGAIGLKTNFGFNVKYNKSGTSLQGRINVIVRAAGGKVYQIKGNQMDSLTVNNTNPASRTAVYTGKANITDITDVLNPMSLGGGHTFQMKLTDNGEPGTTDTIGITVYSNNGGALLFSSKWNGTNTVEQLLNGGNLQVR